MINFIVSFQEPFPIVKSNCLQHFNIFNKNIF